MTDALPSLIVDGLGIAAAPWCIVGVIVILGTARPLADAAAFLGGAVVSMIAVFGLCSLVFGNIDLTNNTTPTAAAAIIQLVSGIALLGWEGGGGTGVRSARRPLPSRLNRGGSRRSTACAR